MISLGITHLPVDPFAIAREIDIVTIPYSKVDDCDLIKSLREKKYSAVATMNTIDNGGYCIMYDDNEPADRIRFSVAHELGHICLGHLVEVRQEMYYYGGDDNVAGDQREYDADNFAGELLRPPTLLAMMNRVSPCEIQDICHVSYESAMIGARRAKAMHKQLSGKYKNIADFYHRQFWSFIKPHKCNHCGRVFAAALPRHCPTCRSTEIAWTFFTPDDNQPRAGENICLGNTYVDIFEQKKFVYDGCGSAAGPDDRYCAYCGAVTEYFHTGKFKHSGAQPNA